MSKAQQDKYDLYRTMGYEYEETTEDESVLLIKREYVGDSSTVLDKVKIDKDGLIF